MGVLIPKHLLLQAGLQDKAEILIEGRILILRQPRHTPRSGWADASRRLGDAGDDNPVLPELANVGDETWKW